MLDEVDGLAHVSLRRRHVRLQLGDGVHHGPELPVLVFGIPELLPKLSLVGRRPLRGVGQVVEIELEDRPVDASDLLVDAREVYVAPPGSALLVYQLLPGLLERDFRLSRLDARPSVPR